MNKLIVFIGLVAVAYGLSAKAEQTLGTVRAVKRTLEINPEHCRSSQYSTFGSGTCQVTLLPNELSVLVKGLYQGWIEIPSGFARYSLRIVGAATGYSVECRKFRNSEAGWLDCTRWETASAISDLLRKKPELQNFEVVVHKH